MARSCSWRSAIGLAHICCGVLACSPTASRSDAVVAADAGKFPAASGGSEARGMGHVKASVEYLAGKSLASGHDGGTETAPDPDDAGDATELDAADGDLVELDAAVRVCVRLQNPHRLAYEVTLNYERRVYQDCRTRWATRLYRDVDQRDVFLNALLAWNLRFWSCSPPPAVEFALIFEEVALSSDDAALLIGHYMAAATELLAMSPDEISTMQAELEQLSQPLLADVSDPRVQDACVDAGDNFEAGADQ